MADNKKIYTIQINGIDQSIKQVDALSDALQFLDKKIKELESRSVSITSASPSSSSGGGGRTAELNTEDKLLKQIQQTEQQIKDARREDYASLLAQKDILKDIVDETKQRAAQERLSVGRYDNSMKGLKQELADVKSVMQTTDLGDEKFQELTQRALQLTNQLKKLEAETGQFGRNVGNYASAAEGFKGIQVNVGGVIREFENAREASRTLNNELKTMAVNGQTDTEEFKNLRQAVMQMESAMNDAKKPMDDLMDAMESFTAIASVSEGLSALFGVDDSEIQRSIQKLLALQNVLKGIETISKQMETGEGIGSWLSKGSEMADKLAASITGVGKASKSATVATKALGTAFKALGIGAVIAGVMALIHIVEEWSEKQKKAAEEAEEAAEKVKKAIDEQRNTFVGASATYMNTASRLSHLRAEYMTTNNELRKTSILKEASEQFKKLGLSVNSVTDAQKILVNQGDKVIEMLRLQGDAAALASLRMEAFKKSFNMLLENGYDVKSASILAGNSGIVTQLDKQMDAVSQKLSKVQKELGIKAKNGSDSIKKTVVDGEALITKARIDAMKEGLNKTITQLEEERKARIAKIRGSGKNYKEVEAEINAFYDRKIEEEIERHTKDVEKMYEDMYKNIRQLQIKNAQKEVQINKENEEIALEDWDKSSRDKYFGTVGSYGVQGKDKLSQETRNLLGIHSQYNDEFRVLTKELVNKLREREVAFNEYDKLLNEQEIREKTYLKDKEETEKEIQKIEETITNNEKTIAEKRSLIEDVKLGLLKDFNEKEIEAEIAQLEASNEINAQILKNKEAYLDKLKGDFDADNEFLKGEVEKNKELLDNASDNYVKFKKSLEGEYGKDNVDLFEGELLNESYSKDLSSLFKQRISAIKAYWEDRKATVLMAAEDVAKSEMKLLKKSQEEEEKASDDNWLKRLEELSKWQEKKKELILVQAKKEKWTEEETNKALNAVDDEYQKSSNTLYTSYKEERQRIAEVYAQKEYQINKNKNDAIKKANVEYHQNELQEFRDFATALDESESKAKTSGLFGFINLGKTKENYKEVLEGYENLAFKLREERDKLNSDFKTGLLDENVYESSIRENDRMTNQVGGKIEELKDKIKDLPREWWETMNQWIQVIGQSMNSILGSLSEIQSNEYDKMIEQQEKYIEEYEELLNKQKDITQEHASAVESIEDELSTARGDRRQQLIDQLNAEMAAQRASLAQEQKIERQKKKAEEKQKKLEHDQAVAKKKMQLAQAAINMAMSISMAAVNSWPIPAIPMMALAAATGAAQIAAIQSQNIPSYGSGGVIQGKSHKEGGVKVLGGQAEVEGGEYITNKVTTSKNVELLEYINTKRRKISLEDLIDFYGGNSQVKKSITTVRTKFADGGMIPTLRNDINLSDRMLTAFEDYSNRPVQVAVVDIIDRTQAVNDVRVMAGLE